jgi:hypothetical protein
MSGKRGNDLTAAVEIFRLRQQVNPIPPFAKTAKSGAPAESKTQLWSEWLERDRPSIVGVQSKEGWATRPLNVSIEILTVPWVRVESEVNNDSFIGK